MIHIETLAERNDRYIREGRTVSGGDGNGPGKPGYKVVTLSDDDAIASNQLDIADADGYEVRQFSGNRVILDNYKKD